MFSKLMKTVQNTQVVEESPLEALSEEAVEGSAGAQSCWMEVQIGHSVRNILHGGYPPEY